MDLKTLNRINNNSKFIGAMEGVQNRTLFILTVVGMVVTGLRHLFDMYMDINDGTGVYELRLVTVALLVLNLLLGLLRKQYKQHVIAGFYFMSAHCLLMAWLTGGMASMYWFGLIYVLVAWFIFMTYRYSEMVLHGTLFVVLFIAVLAFKPLDSDKSYEIFKVLFLYAGTLILGAFSAYNHNKSKAMGFEATHSLHVANHNLGTINEELRLEIEKHQQTLKQLKAKEQFIETIISNAPIVLFSFDTKGIFTYSHGKMLRQLGIDSSSIGKSIFEIYQGTEAETFVRKVLSEETMNGIVQLKGTTFDMRVTPINDESGCLTGYIGVAMDISAQERTRKDLERFKLALDQAPAAIYIINNEMKFDYINPAFTKQSGYTEADTLNVHIIDSIYKGRIPETRQHIVEALRRGQNWQGELESHHKAGSIYWASTVASPYLDTQGKVDGYIIIQQDITEKKNMEEAIKESELLYRTLLENSTDGIALTQDSTVVIANKKFCTMMGYTPDELKSIDPKTIIASYDRDRVLDLHFSRMRGEIDYAICYTADFVRKDGSTFTAELGATTISIKGKNASYVTMRDISERLRMENELALSLKKYRDFAEMLPQTVYELDLEGRQTYMNKAGLEMFRHTGNGIGHQAFDSIAPEDHERMRDNMNKNFQNSKDYTTGNEYTAVRCDGTRFPVIVYAAPIIENGNAIGTRGIIIDISERKAMENALRESELKYKTLVENSQDGIMMVRNDKMLFANDTLCNMLKYNCSVLFSNPASNIIHPTDRIKVFDILKRRQNGEKGIISEELRLVDNDGRVIYASITSSIVDFQGQPASFYTIHDITKRKAMENALRESEMKYKTLVENSQDGIFALLGDQLHFVNNTFCRMLSYAPEEMYKLTPYQLIIEDDYQTAKAIRERRKMGDNSTISGIFRYKTRDGRVLECETYSSVIEMEGKQMSYITVHDLTETRKMQEQLQQSEKKYRTLINKATDGILITQGGVFKFVNPAFCEMMQYTEDELINKPFIEVVDAKHHSEMLDNHKRRMNGESFPAIYRAKLYRKDGSSFMVELNSRTTDFNGNPASFVITRDITDRLKAEEELLKAKTELEHLNQSLEARVRESSENLTEARTQLIRLQKENLQSQFEVLRQQVNPHFLFNSLNVLTSLIKLEPELAEKFTEHLSKVYRYVLENKDNDLVDLKTELDFLDAYLFLLNIRFMDKIQVSINIDKDKHEMLILPLALQLLIENAIKHNSMSKKYPLCINLFIDGNNFLNVLNNLQERESYIASTGVGLKNIEHRYLLLEMPAPEFIKTKNEFIAKIPLK